MLHQQISRSAFAAVFRGTRYWLAVLSVVAFGFSFPLPVLAGGQNANDDFVNTIRDAVVGHHNSVRTIELPASSLRAADDFVYQLERRYKPFRQFNDFFLDEVFKSDAAISEVMRLYNEFGFSAKAYDRSAVHRVVMAVLAGDPTAPAPEGVTTSQAWRYRYLSSYLGRRIQKGLRDYSQYLRDAREPIEEVKLYRFSDSVPDSLEQIAVTLKRHDFWVNVVTVRTSDLEQSAREVSARTEETVYKMIESSQGTVQEKRDLRSKVAAGFSNGWRRVRNFLGWAGGINIIAFKKAVHRTPAQKLAELTAASTTAVFVAQAVHDRIESQIAEGNEANSWLPAVVSVADKLFFGYYQTAVSAFFGQGRKLNPDNNSFESTYFSNLLKIYINSILVRSAMMLATNTHFNGEALAVEVVLTSALFMEAIGSSTRGLYSKGPIQIGLEQLRKALKHRPWLTLSIFTAWNSFWGAVQVWDLYDATLTMPSVMELPNWLGGVQLAVPEFLQKLSLNIRSATTALAISGVAIEAFRKRAGIFKQFEKMGKWLFGKRESHCQYLLSVKPRGSE